MKKLTLILLGFLFVGISSAQIQVFPNNNVGIGTASAASKLSVNCAGRSDYTAHFVLPTGSGTRGGILVQRNQSDAYSSFGLYCSILSNTANSADLFGFRSDAFNLSYTTQTTGRSFGIIGIAGRQASGKNYGLCGLILDATTSYGAGIYGGTTGTTNTITSKSYAGYFDGDAYITGRLWVTGLEVVGSDERLKKNIDSIDCSDKLFTLKPKKYNLKSQNELPEEIKQKFTIVDTASYLSSLKNPEPEPDFIKKKHYGLLAQDVQKVYPDLVYEGENGVIGIDYNGLIPIIIEQMKQMKTALDAKNTEIAGLEKRLKALEKKKQ